MNIRPYVTIFSLFYVYITSALIMEATTFGEPSLKILNENGIKSEFMKLPVINESKNLRSINAYISDYNEVRGSDWYTGKNINIYYAPRSGKPSFKVEATKNQKYIGDFFTINIGDFEDFMDILVRYQAGANFAKKEGMTNLKKLIGKAEINGEQVGFYLFSSYVNGEPSLPIYGLDVDVQSSFFPIYPPDAQSIHYALSNKEKILLVFNDFYEKEQEIKQKGKKKQEALEAVINSQ